MAIYNNREVQVAGMNNRTPSPDTINVIHKDNTRENVPVTSVYFTDAEKKKLIKDHPSRFEDVKTATQADIDAVRAGVTPPSDPSYVDTAKVQVQHEEQQKLIQKHTEAAKAEAKKQLDQDNKKDWATTQTVMNAPKVK